MFYYTVEHMATTLVFSKRIFTLWHTHQSTVRNKDRRWKRKCSKNVELFSFNSQQPKNNNWQACYLHLWHMLRCVPDIFRHTAIKMSKKLTTQLEVSCYYKILAQMRLSKMTDWCLKKTFIKRNDNYLHTEVKILKSNYTNSVRDFFSHFPGGGDRRCDRDRLICEMRTHF